MHVETQNASTMAAADVQTCSLLTHAYTHGRLLLVALLFL